MAGYVIRKRGTSSRYGFPSASFSVPRRFVSRDIERVHPRGLEKRDVGRVVGSFERSSGPVPSGVGAIGPLRWKPASRKLPARKRTIVAGAYTRSGTERRTGRDNK